MNKADILFDKIIKMDDGMLVFDNGDGATKENALMILGAENETEGVQFEYQVLEELFPGYAFLSQSLIHEGDKVYDVIKISCDGTEHEVWFDITEFFGKKKKSRSKVDIEDRIRTESPRLFEPGTPMPSMYFQSKKLN
jgi:hypothetical protein